MNLNFIYFGETCFEKFNHFYHNDPTLETNTETKIFNSATVDSKSCAIKNIFLCWSFCLIQIEDKLYHCGFKEISIGNELSQVYKNSKEIISMHKTRTLAEGWNRVLLISNDGQCEVLSNKENLVALAYDISGINGNVRQVVAADNFNAFLTEDGDAYISKNLTSVPEIVLMSLKVSEISCGKEHTLLLTTTGCIFSIGVGSRGQLGHGSIEDLGKPKLIEALDGVPVKSICCGGWHSAAITIYEDLYTWGWNESGQLGRPCHKTAERKQPVSEIQEICCLPTLVELNKTASLLQIALGSRHSAILCGDGVVLSWGWNGYGQLGRNVQGCCHIPSAIDVPPQFHPVKLKCSLWSTLIIADRK